MCLVWVHMFEKIPSVWCERRLCKCTSIMFLHLWTPLGTMNNLLWCGIPLPMYNLSTHVTELNTLLNLMHVYWMWACSELVAYETSSRTDKLDKYVCELIMTSHVQWQWILEVSFMWSMNWLLSSRSFHEIGFAVIQNAT